MVLYMFQILIAGEHYRYFSLYDCSFSNHSKMMTVLKEGICDYVQSHCNAPTVT